MSEGGTVRERPRSALVRSVLRVLAGALALAVIANRMNALYPDSNSWSSRSTLILVASAAAGGLGTYFILRCLFGQLTSGLAAIAATGIVAACFARAKVHNSVDFAVVGMTTAAALRVALGWLDKSAKPFCAASDPPVAPPRPRR